MKHHSQFSEQSELTTLLAIDLDNLNQTFLIFAFICFYRLNLVQLRFNLVGNFLNAGIEQAGARATK